MCCLELKRSVERIKAYSLALPLLLVTTAGCPPPPCAVGSPVTIPASDSTPPTATMDVHFPNKPMLTVRSGSADAMSTVGANDVITLIAAGNDPEGVKDIQIWVEETWWYPDDKRGQDCWALPNRVIQTAPGREVQDVPRALRRSTWISSKEVKEAPARQVIGSEHGPPLSTLWALK
jgi:hypothetical protein